jgi:DNA-binding response OmpR family regulator
MTGPRVLLVDDDQEICDFLSMLLQLEGFSPVSVTRAADALARATEESPAVLLVDVAMPDLDGLELCRRLRSAGLRAPILVVSARPGQALRRRAIDAGADEFIRKPFDNADLVSRIRHWVDAGAARTHGTTSAGTPVG